MPIVDERIVRKLFIGKGLLRLLIIKKARQTAGLMPVSA